MKKYYQNYLKNKPLFYSLIRPQEAYLFNKYNHLLKFPILDFGCGDGFFAEAVFGKGIIDVGIDLESNKHTADAERREIYKEVVSYDGRKLPFPNNYFSTIISNCVLEHIPNIDYSLKEIGRILKPNGYFLTTVMTNQWSDNLLGGKILGSLYINWLRRKQKHYQLLSLSQWQRSFERSRFKIIKEKGYLSPQNSRYLEIYHYLSLLGPLGKFLFGRSLRNKINLPANSALSSALFFILKKPSAGK